MSESWQVFASYGDVASAEAVAGLLRSESVPVQLASDEPIPGLVMNVRVMVPSDLMHRAKWIMSQAQLSDAELIFLATGKLDGDDAE
ncbi:MAG TPA: hypothetical protein VET48_01025 [Steroidobacteraceae bacterium]|nr:hypothetical protein [Steroidobacteraceae bacterium]